MSEHLSDRPYKTLALRMNISRDGGLLYGEVRDLDNQLVGRFRSVQAMTEIVDRWLKAQVSRLGDGTASGDAPEPASADTIAPVDD